MSTPKKTTVESIAGSLWAAIQPYLKDGVNEKELVAGIAKVIGPNTTPGWFPITCVHRDDVLATFGFCEELDGTLLYSGPESEEEQHRKIVEWFVKQEDVDGEWLLMEIAGVMASALLDGMYWEILEQRVTQAYEADADGYSKF